MAKEFDDIQTIHYLSDLDDNDNDADAEHQNHHNNNNTHTNTNNQSIPLNNTIKQHTDSTSQSHRHHHPQQHTTNKHKHKHYDKNVKIIQPNTTQLQHHIHHHRHHHARSLHTIESRLQQLQYDRQQRQISRKHQYERIEHHRIQKLQKSLDTLNLRTATKSEAHLKFIKKLNHTYHKWMDPLNHQTGTTTVNATTAAAVTTENNNNTLMNTTEYLINQQNHLIKDIFNQSTEMNHPIDIQHQLPLTSTSSHTHTHRDIILKHQKQQGQND